MLSNLRSRFAEQIERAQRHRRGQWSLGKGVREEFARIRQTEDYRSAWTNANPLVSICIGTYNRGPLLVERAIRSSLAQTHSNIEVIVVGDGCSDDTAERVSKISDPRLSFVNLPRRGDYPIDPRKRWAVAGTAPVNHALPLCAGDFITHLDDDDEHEPNRIEVLLAALQSQQADLVYHPFAWEQADGSWIVNEARQFAYAQVTTSSVLYHRWFRQIAGDPFAYRFGEPGDWNRFQRFAWLGAKIVRCDEVLLRHYRERNQTRD